MEDNTGDCATQGNKGDYVNKEDWTQSVDLSEFCDATVREKAWKRLGRYSGMRPGELGRIAKTENWILLKQGQRNTLQMPYRQGPEMRVVTQSQVEGQLRAAIIEPANSE